MGRGKDMKPKFKVLKKPKAIYIKWLDHFSHKDRWSSIDCFANTDEGISNETIGWLCAESKLCYAISLTYCSEINNSCDSITVLKSCVIKKKFIKI